MSLRRALTFLISFLFFLSGCQSPVYNQAVDNTADAKYKIAVSRANMAVKVKSEPSLVVNEGLYIDKRPINLQRDPSWLHHEIVLRGEELPFSYFSRTIASGGSRHLLTRYQSGLDDKVTLSMNYAGTVKGALDLLSSKSGYIYTINGNDVYWESVVTKTFQVAFMPGTSDYLMGKASGGSGTSTSSANGVTTTSATVEDSASAQYSSLKGTLSIWNDLGSSLKQMLSKDGSFVVSQSTTSLTVTDHPANVKLIGQFIDNLNQNLSRQVLVKIEVLTVQLESDFNFGINWNIVQRAFGNGYYQLVSNNGTPLTLTSLIGLNSTTTNQTQAGINNPNTSAANGVTGVTALANALQTQGKVSIVTQPQVLAQNNQVSSIRILDQRGYVQSVQQTSTGTTSSGSSAVTSQVTPGNLQTGLTLYVLPKILGDKVYLQVNADLSTFINLQDFTAGTGTGAPVIQIPHTTQRQFSQRSVIKSGDTLILAGFKEIDNASGASQMMGSQALGGKTAQQTNTETIVLITPIILHGYA